MPELILASASPRRQELMRLAGLKFQVIPANIEEKMDQNLPITARLEKLAYEKGRPIHDLYPDAVVVSADTVVVLDDEVIGKAADRAMAGQIIRKLADRTHVVYTAVCVQVSDQRIAFTTSSEVTFYPVTDDELEDYLDTDDWIGKAGAYALQGAACRFVREIHGDYTNVIGLPIARLCQVLKKITGGII